jgi:hypothetical protein
VKSTQSADIPKSEHVQRSALQLMWRRRGCAQGTCISYAPRSRVFAPQHPPQRAEREWLAIASMRNRPSNFIQINYSEVPSQHTLAPDYTQPTTKCSAPRTGYPATKTRVQLNLPVEEAQRIVTLATTSSIAAL